ncbi:uncharacterized protein LOC8262840 [Ricinus communis]|uniref:Agglutinin domain-containing protein n=1 Tax=Ricinus communis TaxID=3988 RepID=B9SC09_RICCO|nr:uncharacterized protein LOC8262840 [Ricinus communis]EEF38867.1 conserved hypothetical protein [Ricinus communis]|eukprot:XP_002523528.1 uncharacterized protein LOC8262840 [Ricinus communis]
MAPMLPKSVAIRSEFSRGYAYYMAENEAVRGFIRCEGENILNPYVKIEVETAQIDSKFVHLRFSHTNKYWGRSGPGFTQDDYWVSATSDQPEEDTSKWSCTLFEPIFDHGFLFLRHVQTGGRVRTDGPIGATGPVSRLLLYFRNYDNVPYLDFTFFDLGTLCILPKRVAFRGYNDMYLKAEWIERHEYLQFSSDDVNEKAAGYEITMMPDGHVRLRSNFFNKFWRRSPNWIWADSTDTVGSDRDTLFWPVKVNDDTIALRNAGNNRFCSSLTAERKTDCLNAAVATITREARLQVEELVFERSIFNVRFLMEYARIFDERATVAGWGSAENQSEEAATLSITVGYEDTTSFTFSNSLAITAGVTVGITTGLPRIAEGKIEISTEVTNTLEWNRTTSETRTASATYLANVPARSRIRIDYVATRGTCNIPFSYTQRDRLSHDGSFATTQHVDGVYTGVNYYSFHFEQPQIVPL